MKNKVNLLLLALLLSTYAHAQITLLQQNFEQGILPPGWTKTQNTPSVGFEFGDNLSSTYFPVPAHTKYAVSNDDKHDDNTTATNKADRDRLITPALNFSSYNGVAITFSYFTTSNYGSTAHLEISTDNGVNWTELQTLAPASVWQTVTVNLSNYLLNGVKIAFRHNDHNNWAEGLAVDDVSIYSLAATNAEATDILVPDFALAGNTNINAVVKNMGTSTISSIKLEYSVNGQTPVVQTFQLLNIATNQTDTLTFTTSANLSVPGQYEICLAIKETNGNAEIIKSNDSICKQTSVLSAIPVKKVLLEEATGAWSQFAPDGSVFAANIANNYPNAIVVALHNSDGMDFAEGNEINSEYITAYPAGMVDRYNPEGGTEIEVSRGEWEARISQRFQQVSPVAVSIKSQTWDSVTRVYTTTIEADFKGPVTGDLRMNLFVVEDSVTGTGSDFNQVNYYNTVAGHPYYGAGNPIVGFAHHHVVRAMLGGAWGTPGIMPANIPSDTKYTYTYTDTLPVEQNENRIKLVAIVQKYNADKSKREIVNSEVAALDLTPEAPNGITEAANTFVQTRIYPNPFTTQLNIEFELKESLNVDINITDITGRVVALPASGYYNNGSHTVSYTAQGLANGMYFVNILTGKNRFTQRVILNQ